MQEAPNVTGAVGIAEKMEHHAATVFHGCGPRRKPLFPAAAGRKSARPAI